MSEQNNFITYSKTFNSSFIPCVFDVNYDDNLNVIEIYYKVNEEFFEKEVRKIEDVKLVLILESQMTRFYRIFEHEDFENSSKKVSISTDYIINNLFLRLCIYNEENNLIQISKEIIVTADKFQKENRSGGLYVVTFRSFKEKYGDDRLNDLYWLSEVDASKIYIYFNTDKIKSQILEQSYFVTVLKDKSIDYKLWREFLRWVKNSILIGGVIAVSIQELDEEFVEKMITDEIAESDGFQDNDYIKYTHMNLGLENDKYDFWKRLAIYMHEKNDNIKYFDDLFEESKRKYETNYGGNL